MYFKRYRSNSSNVTIDAMAEAINQGLQEYANLATEEMKSAVNKSANEVKKQIQATAPVRTGKYASYWTVSTTEETGSSLQKTVHAKAPEYRLAHLLEHGHANRGGGRTKAYPHIAPAEAEGEEMLKKLIEEALG